MKTSMAKTAALLLAAGAALPATALSAQQVGTTATQDQIDVYGTLPTSFEGLEDGPDIDGVIAARRGPQIQVRTEDGGTSEVNVAAITTVKSRGGFLGLGRTELDRGSLMNGLPVQIETKVWEGGLIAESISFKDKDLERVAMIRDATGQRFGENEAAIAENAAATEALRGRFGDIDQYNIKDTTNVYFDSGKWNLGADARAELCGAALQANSLDNALLLVVGYTDSQGDQDFNQELSEKRAGRVVNFLQQECDWEPWRMLTPTGMSESDPLADNSTAAGRAQNRRVSVNILVSEALDDMDSDPVASSRY